jgi:hypothetical protein
MHHQIPLILPAVKGAVEVTQFQVVGAAGPYRDLVNGLYESTMQMCGGKTVYHKLDNSDIWMEHDAKVGEWNVLNTAHRGLSWGFASFKSQNDVSSFEGKSGWKVFDGKVWADQPSVHLKMVSLAVPRFVVPDVPRQPPPPPPVAVPGSVNASAPRVHGINAANTAGIASELRCISPRLKPPQAEDHIARHLDFVVSRAAGAADSPRLNAFTGERSYDSKDSRRESLSNDSTATSSNRNLPGASSAAPSYLSSHASRGGSLNGSVRSSSSSSSSSSQRTKPRRLHIDDLEPGHPQVIMRISNQQILPVSSLADRMADLNLQSVQAAAAVVDGIAAERTCAKMCVWGTPRFCRVSEMAVDVLLASGRRMEADGDVYLVREGEDISGVFFFVASGQIKFIRYIPAKELTHCILLVVNLILLQRIKSHVSGVVRQALHRNPQLHGRGLPRIRRPFQPFVGCNCDSMCGSGSVEI